MNIPVILKELTKVGVVALTEKSVETFVETKIKPIFENWGKEESRSIELEECLSEYLLRCYGKNNIMTTIVFGRMQKTLEDLYIPLTLEEYRNKDKKWVIDEKCYDILDNYSRILVIDMAGMGKSTIVKYFACQGVNLDKCIPIVIELRKLEKGQTILEYIQKQINSYDKNIEISEIVDILKKGDFVIFFDGYDEIANENKPDVLEEIQEFTSKASNTKIVITSREEEDLNSLGEYKCVNIKPLAKEEAYMLIKKYDNDGDISKKLIKRLEEDLSMKVLDEFLKNPLLVSLLYKTFEYKEEIPYKKIDFYEQVYAALFNDHDKTKGSAYVHEKKTKLDKYQFEQILRAFGFLCLKADKVEYSSQLIYQLLKQSIERFGWLKINVDDFLHDITHAVPFVQKEGTEYKWVHKSFMEYFASCFICYDNRKFEEKNFNKMISSGKSMKYYNVLDFCFEIDTLNFRKYVILPFLKDYVKKYNTFFQDNIFNDFDKKYLDIARQLLFLNANVWLINNIYVDKVNDIQINENNDREKNEDEVILIDQMFEECRNTIEDELRVNRMSHMFQDNFVYAYEYIDLLFYRLIADKMPMLFQKLHLKKEPSPLCNKNIKVKFDDNVNNLINQNNEVFSVIVKNIYEMLFWNFNKCLLYDECKKLIAEIEAEDSFINNDIFDL